MKAKLVTLFLLVAALPAAAQQQPAPNPSAKEEKIRELLRVTGSGRLAVQVIDQMLGSFRQAMPDVPAAFWDDFRREARPEDLEELIVPIYASHYDEADIQGLLDFYASPVGRKMLKETPGVVSESMEAGRKWGGDLARKIVEKLKKSGYKTSGA
jgi:hypothetical protein